jgi:penicillin amidase
VFSPGEDYAQSAVSSYRQIIDLADFDRSLSVITTGNSGNPASPFYRDQAEMWRTGGYHPAPFSRTAVEEASLGRFILTPA